MAQGQEAQGGGWGSSRCRGSHCPVLGMEMAWSSFCLEHHFASCVEWS